MMHLKPPACRSQEARACGRPGVAGRNAVPWRTPAAGAKKTKRAPPETAAGKKR